MMRLSLIKAERRRFIIFIAVGILNTLFGYGAFALFLLAGLSNDLAVLFGMIAGILFNYATVKQVFSAHGLTRLPHFLVAYAVLLIINISSLRLLSSQGVNAFLGEAIIVICLTPISFLAMRFLVFPGSKHNDHVDPASKNLANGKM
jgi:putative flippase GtrA